MKYLRLLLFPFAVCYGMVVIIRNWLYNSGFYKTRKFYVPVIGVGNLDVGGAGKSPMTEYLVRLLKPHYKLATLSRGYGRNTVGFVVASDTSPRNSSPMIGDEPAQFHQKFPDITVAVCEDRVVGIKQLKEDHKLIILDDAFQHRAVKPGLNILLFDYNRLNYPRFVLPMGNLREPFSGRRRADVIIVTKCPPDLSEGQQEGILNRRIKPFSRQQTFFTSIVYEQLQDANSKPVNPVINSDTTIFLLTGIANADPLVAHLKTYTQHIVHHNYPDHHPFTLNNMTKLADEFSACESKNKLVITTEKDAQRLVERTLQDYVKELNILVLPIGIAFLKDSAQQFDQLVKKYVREHTEHHKLH